MILSTKKILIVKPSSLGDVIHSLPTLNALKMGFPKAEVHWVIAKGLEGLLEGNHMISKLWIINKDAWKSIKNISSTMNELRMLFKALRNERFDLVIDLQGLLRSGILVAFTGAPLRVGFKEAREGSSLFYTHRVKGGNNIHAVDRYLKIARFLGCHTSDVLFHLCNDLSYTLPFTGDYVVMVPGARKPAKRWPAHRFGELASLLPIKTLVIGSSEDIYLADAVVERSKGSAISLAGKTDLKALIKIIRGARFVVSNDSGPMHIAAALGVPVFAIFGPTDPKRTGPYGKGHTIIREDISCAPCFKKKCKSAKCMQNLSTEKVYEAIKTNFKIF